MLCLNFEFTYQLRLSVQLSPLVLTYSFFKALNSRSYFSGRNDINDDCSRARYEKKFDMRNRITSYSLIFLSKPMILFGIRRKYI